MYSEIKALVVCDRDEGKGKDLGDTSIVRRSENLNRVERGPWFITRNCGGCCKVI